MAGELPTTWKEHRENNFLVLAWDSKSRHHKMLHTWSKSPASVLHSKCRSTEGWLSHFFEVASTGIAEVTWRRAPIHTKIGRSSCCDFYSCNCPSLGIATAAEQKYSPPGHWDVGLQWRKKSPGTTTSSQRSTGSRSWEHSSVLSEQSQDLSTAAPPKCCALLLLGSLLLPGCRTAQWAQAALSARPQAAPLLCSGLPWAPSRR